MVERVEITDEKSARAWLEMQDHQTQVWFATRCALRLFPLLGTAPDVIKRGNGLAYLRALSISACFGADLKPPDHFRIVSTSAFLHLNNARDATGCGHGEEVALVRSATRAAIKSLANKSGSAAIAARPYAWSKIACKKLDNEEILIGNLLMESDRGEIAAREDLGSNYRWPALWGTAGWPSFFEDSWDAIKEQWDTDAADWSFWIEWYEALLSGTSLPWELTQRIALEITDTEWKEGQATIACRIEEIRTKWRLEEEIQRLKEQLSLTAELSQAHRKHNNPPPLDGEAGLVMEAVTLIWEEIGTLEAAIAKPGAEPSALQKIARRLWSIAEQIAIYCGVKIDMTLEAAAKELGSTGIKWTVRSGAAYWISTQEGTQTVAKLAWQYAEKLLTGG